MRSELPARAVSGVLAALVLVACLWSAPPSRAAFPGGNGPIVFYGKVGATTGLWRVDPDGGAPTAITGNVGADNLRVAPDGVTVGYAVPGSGPPNFWTVRTDGTGLTRSGLSVRSAGAGTFTAFTPDSRVVHAPPLSGSLRLHVANLDGSQDVTLTADDALRERPVVTPDGATVYYVRQSRPVGGETPPRVIYKMPLAGGAETPVITGGTLAPFDISPDGTKLLYGTFNTAAQGMRIRDLGTGADTLVASGQFLAGAHFSPDGDQIVYAAGANSIRVVEPDGTGDHELPVTGLAAQVTTVTWAASSPNADIVVNVTGDQANDADSRAEDVCDVDPNQADEQCTLRAATELANDRGGARVTFDIPGGGVPRIEVTPDEDDDAALPVITTRTEIDGTTQPGGWVEVAGLPDARPAMGILVEAGGGGSEVRGLVIHGFQEGEIRAHANGTTIEGNRIGTDVTGTQARGSLHAHQAGVAISGNHNRVVGNVIAGERYEGADTPGGTQVYVNGDDNRLEGNRIGIGADGHVVALPAITNSRDGYVGVVIIGARNVVGGGATAVPAGACESPCNLIAGMHVPVAIGDHPLATDPTLTVGTEVSGNWIGVEADGAPAFVGGPAGTSGISDFASEAQGSVMTANLVHADANALSGGAGARIVANRAFGRATGFDPLWHSPNGALVTAGGGAEVLDNMIRSSSYRGVIVDGSSGATVARNTITDNPLGGILIHSGAGHVIADNELRDNGLVGIGATHFDSGDPVPMAVLARNRISGSAIGIDLFPFTGAIVELPPWGRAFPGDGVTENDINDGDDGPNGHLNFPEVLSASGDGGALTVRGFVEAPVLGSADYLVEAFTSPTCAAALLGGQAYGAGAHYVGVGGGTSSGGYADFTLTLSGVPAGDRVLSLTATRLDLGATSEFSRCVPLAGSGQVAQSDVAAGETGPVLDEQSATVAISDAGAPKRAAVSAHGGGTVYLTRYTSGPGSNAFADATASGAAGTEVRPEAVAARYWLLTDRGLTTDGGATSADAATFDVCLDATDVVAATALDQVVVVRRAAGTQGKWQPHATDRTTHAGRPYLCARGLTRLGELGLGGAASAFRAPDPTPGTPGSPPPSAPPTDTPPAQVTPKPTAKLKAIDGKARVVSKSARLQITCGAAAACNGTVRLTAKLGRRSKAIGGATFKIPASSTRTVKVKLSRAALKAVKLRTLKAKATATVGSSSVSKTVRLTADRERKHRHDDR